MIEALARIGVVLLSLTGVAFSAMAVFLLRDVMNSEVEDSRAETVFGMFCAIIGFSMVMTAVAVARSLE